MKTLEEVVNFAWCCIERECYGILGAFNFIGCLEKNYICYKKTIHFWIHQIKFMIMNFKLQRHSYFI